MGIITEIQRFSLNDGPGIRTTVFFKGCNMRCLWCHNPETFIEKPQIMFTATKCIGCGACLSVCESGAHTFLNGKHIIDREKCADCFKCTDACYPEALRKIGKEASAEDVYREIAQDKAYYLQSGGGVTLSGGEVLLQADFALEILKKCRENGIKTAVETNLSVDFSHLKKLLPYLDLVMCDIKLFDAEIHKKYTGIGNERVLENIKLLDEEDVPIIVRTPLIPGATDTEENIGNIAKFLKSVKNLVRYELLNFNPLGAAKYDELDTDNPFKSAKPLSEERLNILKKVATDEGISVKAV